MQGAQAVAAGREDTFQFRISMSPPESELVAWLESGVPEVVYCRGYVLLRDTPAVKLVQAWHRAGLVDFKQKKIGNVTEWIAERRAAAGSAPLPDAKAAKVEHIAQIQMRELLGLLRDAAAAGLPCPSGTALARAVTGQTDQRARNRVVHLRKRLVAEGKIAVAAGTHARKPVVTILARGKGCGMSTASTVLEGEG
jgi:hypothetical protein